MTSATFWHRDRQSDTGRSPSFATLCKRSALAALLLAVFALAYGGTVALLMHQAAFLAAPGDRLMVVFPRDTGTATALERIGAAGATYTGSSRWIHQAEVIDASAAEQLARDAWVMRFPGRPALEGCFSVARENR